MSTFRNQSFRSVDISVLMERDSSITLRVPLLRAVTHHDHVGTKRERFAERFRDSTTRLRRDGELNGAMRIGTRILEGPGTNDATVPVLSLPLSQLLQN